MPYVPAAEWQSLHAELARLHDVARRMRGPTYEILRLPDDSWVELTTASGLWWSPKLTGVTSIRVHVPKQGA